MMPGPARMALGIGRLVLAVAVAGCLVARYLWGIGWVEPGNFFAYLTIQSNIAFAGVAGVSGVVALRRGLDHPRLDVVRGAVLTYVVTAGLVYALIVQQGAARGFPIPVPWSDVALHWVLPVFGIADWLLSRRRHGLRWRVLGVIIAYPIGWGIVTMIRGPLVDWYPYYFLDPTQVSDPLEFITLCSLALAVFGVVGSGVILTSPASRRTARAAREPLLPARRHLPS